MSFSVARLLERGLIDQIMPLHEREHLQKLKTEWVQTVDSQPLSLICDYYGTQIGMFCCFSVFFLSMGVRPTSRFISYCFGLESCNPTNLFRNVFFF